MYDKNDLNFIISISPSSLSTITEIFSTHPQTPVHLFLLISEILWKRRWINWPKQERDLIIAVIATNHSAGWVIRNNMKWPIQERNLINVAIATNHSVSPVLRNYMNWHIQEINLINVAIATNHLVSPVLRNNMNWPIQERNLINVAIAIYLSTSWVIRYDRRETS